MTTVKIRAGGKFALIALPRANVAHSATDMSLADDLLVTREMPLPVADHWQRWIGEVPVKQLQEAGCFILAKTPADTPAILDGENQNLMRRVCHVYDGLTIVEVPFCATRPFLLPGANVNGDVSIRQIADLQAPVRRAFNQSSILRQIDEAGLRKAYAIGDALAVVVAPPDHIRLKLALSAFLAGVRDVRFDESLHQFCRWIDGTILSRKGKGEADFVARSALFIGAGQDAAIGEMYRMRNAVEHLRPAESEAVGCIDRRAQRLRVIERSTQVEKIARYCLQRVLLNPELVAAGKDEASLEQFWSRSEDDRRKAWGNPLDFNQHLAVLVDPQYVTNQDLGLN